VLGEVSCAKLPDNTGDPELVSRPFILPRQIDAAPVQHTVDALWAIALIRNRAVIPVIREIGGREDATQWAEHIRRLVHPADA
jgi:hypothetical protein